MMRFISAGALLVLALAACGGAAKGSHAQAQGEAPHLAALGQEAPQWQLPTTTGTSLTMASLRGKIVYLNFFASWCPPCNEEAPDVQALSQKYAAQGVQVVGVDIMENSTKAASFMHAHHLLYPAVVDSGTLRDAYQINGLPVHVFIDRNGVVRKMEIGELSRAQMETDIRGVLSGAKAGS